MTTTDRQAFLDAIIREPDDDTTRLVFADFLDEHGEPDRAEFIRVQCELERIGRRCPFTVVTHVAERSNIRPQFPPVSKPKQPCGWCPVCKSLQRERELLARHEADWRRAGACTRCQAVGNRWLMCNNCYGTGDRGGLLRTTYSNEVKKAPLKVEFRRGFPHRVMVPQLTDALHPVENGRDVFGQAEHDLKPTPWLSAVLRHHPVQEVVSLDKTPYWNGASHVWYRENRRYPSDSAPAVAELPDALFDAIDRPGYEILRRAKGEATPELAITALARAVVRIRPAVTATAPR